MSNFFGRLFHVFRVKKLIISLKNILTKTWLQSGCQEKVFGLKKAQNTHLGKFISEKIGKKGKNRGKSPRIMGCPSFAKLPEYPLV